MVFQQGTQTRSGDEFSHPGEFGVPERPTQDDPGTRRPAPGIQVAAGEHVHGVQSLPWGGGGRPGVHPCLQVRNVRSLCPLQGGERLYRTNPRTTVSQDVQT